jgi:hypothetical protein
MVDRSRYSIRQYRQHKRRLRQVRIFLDSPERRTQQRLVPIALDLVCLSEQSKRRHNHGHDWVRLSPILFGEHLTDVGVAGLMLPPFSLPLRSRRPRRYQQLPPLTPRALRSPASSGRVQALYPSPVPLSGPSSWPLAHSPLPLCKIDPFNFLVWRYYWTFRLF